ncbi:hypothetical protein [Bradyrhizobium sp. USDA 10063]
MKWILYVMLFSTPAANVTHKDDKECLKNKEVWQIEQILKCRPAFEAKRIWSLQATSQFEYKEFESCVRTQDQLMADTNVASTMTVRTWCFCEAENLGCPTDQLALRLAATYRLCEKDKIRDCRTRADATIKKYNEEEAEKIFRPLGRPPSPPDDSTPLPPPPPTGRNSSSIRLYPPP